MSEQMPHVDESAEARRQFLKRAGQFAIYTPPALMLLLHPSRKAIAQSLGRMKGNNGVGNGVDPPPNGQPFQTGGWTQNDAPGFAPGNPGYRGGNPNTR